MALFAKDNDKKNKVAAKPKAAPAASMQELYSEGAAKPAHKAAKASGKTADISRIAAAASVLVRPLITEKATNLSAVGKYVFVVSAGANKISVARAIVAAYGVKPVRVNLMNMDGKKVSRGRVNGQRSDWRKAIVTLPKGQAIKIYEGV